MKLGALKSAIRDLNQAPKVMMRFGNGQILQLDVQKTPLLAHLDEAFPEGRSVETGLGITPDGFLTQDMGTTDAPSS